MTEHLYTSNSKVIKRFITRTIAFVCTVLGVYLIIGIVAVKRSARNSIYKMPEDRSIIVVGNSHAQQAINDTLLNESYNISESGSTYIYEYAKMI